jgi:hypothetical protein
MATTTSEPRDLAPDLMGVKSRISWSAILGGTVFALATYFVLTLFLAAVGISLTEAGVRDNAVGIGVLGAMILVIAISLFLGGWVSSQLTAGETRHEAAIYGILTWAAVTGISIALVGMGVRAGYYAVLGGSIVAQNNERIPAWEDAARQAGVPQAQIDSAKAAVDPNRVRAEATNPQNQEKAREAAMAAAWAALVGTMLSMAAAVGGAMTGRGTAFRLFPVATVVHAQPNSNRLVTP